LTRARQDTILVVSRGFGESIGGGAAIICMKAAQESRLFT
jgi:hypothetical protein